MIKTEYTYSKIKIDDLKVYQKRIDHIVEIFNNADSKKEMIGWYDFPLSVDENFISRLKKDAADIRGKSDVFVVCGIGGSYLGAKAVIEAIKGFKNEIEILYIGNTFDERYTGDCLKYLENKDFCVNVISKSGGTLETSISFRMIKKLLKNKYGSHYRDRVYVTTDGNTGLLKKISDDNGYKTYYIPSNIGGRYSVFTPVGLLPLAVAGVDIKSFIDGAKSAHKHVQMKKMEENIAYQYAAYRYKKYKEGLMTEMFAAYSPYLDSILEWWKQLFGESEGKENKGLLPTSVNFSTDLHSLGQFIQQGTKCLFITQFKVKGKDLLKIGKNYENEDGLNYLSELTLNEINQRAQEGTNKAHFEKGQIDHFTFCIEEVNEYNIAFILYVFMYSCMISANLLEVNPFDQPGVELYKSEIKKLLQK